MTFKPRVVCLPGDATDPSAPRWLAPVSPSRRGSVVGARRPGSSSGAAAGGPGDRLALKARSRSFGSGCALLARFVSL